MEYFAHSCLDLDVKFFNFAMQFRILFVEELEQNLVMRFSLVWLIANPEGLPI